MPTKTPVKKTSPKTARDGKSSGLQKPLQPSKELAAVIGFRASVTRRGGEQGLGLHQDAQPAEPREPPRDLGADDKLRKVFGKDKVTMFEMNKHLAQHLT